jgi:hypothetical protein
MSLKESSVACEKCGSTDEELRTHKCPVCYKMFCEDCSVSMSGRSFCSRFCAEYFFFGGDDDT